MQRVGGRLAGALRLGMTVSVLTAGVWPHVARAQAVSGTILGEVRDAGRAFVPGATIVVVNTGTGFTRTVVTDSRGEYTAPSLPTGTYRVSAELTGFKKVTVSSVRLGVDQKVRIDLELSVGALAEVVDVQGGAPLVQASSSDLSATVDGRQIETLPLNGRNIVSLTRTIPGVTRGIPGANIDGGGGLAWRASASFSANGQRPRDNNFLLDGVDNNETWLQSIVIFPNVDALDEFKLQTSTYSAEFGQSLGGVVNLQIKSGTNQYHGGAFGFLRNDALDANNFFNNKAGIARPQLSQYQFGGTLGGPIRKDRTFFFADYQGLRSSQGVNKVSTVPSALMRQGNFSEVNRVIYDPLTGRPFPGSVIPDGRWDPAAANILAQLIPPPNTAGRRSPSGQIVENFVINPIQEREDDQFDVKIDHALSDANRFFVRYSFEKSRRFLPASLPQGDGFANVDSVIKAQSVSPQRHPHLRSAVAQRAAARLQLLRAGGRAAWLRPEHRGGDGHPQRQPRRRVHLGHERDQLRPGRHADPGHRSAPHHQPGQPAGLRQRDPRPGAAHPQGRSQRHLSLTGDPQRGQPAGPLRASTRT